MKTNEKIEIRPNGTKRVMSINDEPSLTQQHMKDTVSITSILERYNRTGEFHHTNKTPGQYGDFSQYQDLRSSIHKVQNAQMQFDALPAILRSKFSNDPAQLIEYLQNDANNQEAIELGFKVKPISIPDPKSETPPQPKAELSGGA